MKSNVILTSVAVGLFLIGVHQSIYVGLHASYWIFMLVGCIYLFMQYQNKKKEEKEQKTSSKNQSKNK